MICHATMRSNDDDIIGLVWNYVDANNYYRVGIRQQPGQRHIRRNEGLAVQKIVGGVVTQIVPLEPVWGRLPDYSSNDRRSYRFQFESGRQMARLAGTKSCSMAIQSLAGRMRALLTEW